MAPKSKNQKHDVDQKRFSIFLRFLDEHNAKIELTHRNGGKFIYTSNQNDGNPSIRELLKDEPLNLSENAVSELYLDWHLQSKHSYKSRIRENIKIIDGVSFYLNSDGRVDESTNTLKLNSAFGLRNQESGIMELKHGGKVFNDIEFLNDEIVEVQDCDPKWGQYLGNKFEEFPKYVISTINEFRQGFDSNFAAFYNQKNHLYNGLGVEFKYSHILNKFPIVYCSSPFFNKYFIEEKNQSSNSSLWGDKNKISYDINEELEHFPFYLEKTIKKAIDIYSNFWSSNDRNGFLMPNYRDFCVPNYIKYSKLFQNFTRNKDTRSKFYTEEIDIDWAIEHRYEVIELLIDLGRTVDMWHPVYHSLVVIAYLELVAFESLINDSIEYLVSDTRFIVSGSKEFGDIDYQQDSINLDQLSHLLSGYLFKKGLKNTIKFNDLNILEESVYRYSNKNAVKSKFEPEELKAYMNTMFKGYYKKRILQDNFINNETVEKTVRDIWD